MLNKWMIIVIILLFQGQLFASEVVRCGGKLYSLEFVVNNGNPPVDGARIFKEGELGAGYAVLTSFLLGTLQRTYPYYNKPAASYIQNILNEAQTSGEYLWKKTKLGFPSRSVTPAQLKLNPSCYVNGRATIFEIIRYSKLGSINLFEYDEKLFSEIAQSDLQKNFVLLNNFFSLYVKDLKNRANLSTLIMTREILHIPNEILYQIIGSFGLSTPDLSGICSRSPLMGDFLQRNFALNCDLIDVKQLATIKTVNLTGTKGVSDFLYAQDFQGLTGLENLTIEKTNEAPETLLAANFQAMPNLTTIKLPRNQLRNVPCQVLSGSTKLNLVDLSENAITEYPRHSLCGGFGTYTKAERALILSNNGINKSPRATTYLYAGAFEGAQGLTQLFMKNMNISDIPRGVLDDLINLKVLDLSQNNLLTADFLLSTKTIQTLVYLDFSKNPIKTFSPGFWAGFKKLEVLKLENMGLHELPDLKQAKTLKELTICNKFLAEKMSSWIQELKLANPKLIIKQCR